MLNDDFVNLKCSWLLCYSKSFQQVKG